jgi:signal transduction histidine kinase
MVTLIAVVVFSQALALLINAGLTLFDTDSQQLPTTALFFLVFLYLLGAVWLIGAAVGVIRGKAWPRGALIVIEVLAVIVSISYFQLGQPVLGSALALSGAVVLIGLFTPALNEHLVKRRNAPDA